MMLDLLYVTSRIRPKTILTAEKKLIDQITGTPSFQEDIAPQMPSLRVGARITVFGEERRIEQGM
ncbi:MAG: hypothetical protein ACLT76_18300 [Clostridium fessum]